MFTRIETCFNLLTRQGPRCGYHRKPSKRVLIVHPNHPEAGKWFGARHGFKVCTGARYLRGYIGYGDSKRDFLKEVDLIRAVTGGGDFSNANNLLGLTEERIDGQKNRGGANEAKLKGLVKDLKITNMRLILQAQTQVLV